MRAPGWAARTARAGRGRLARLATLRARLVAITVLLLLLGLLISDTVMLTTVRGRLLDRVDTQTRQLAAVLARVPVPPRAGNAPDIGLTDPVAGLVLANLDLISAFSLFYVGPDGERLLTLRVPDGAGGPRLPHLDPAFVEGRAGRVFTVPDTAGGDDWRVVALPCAESGPGSATGGALPAGSSAVVAVSEREVNGATGRVAAACLLTGAVLVAALGLAGWLAVRSQLRPLRVIEGTAAAIAAGDLGRRVPEDAPADTEVGRLTHALNGMLARLEAAFAARALANERMRDFVADVSHELRTPLFAIHGSTQLYELGGLTEPGELDRTMTRIREESARLARLATDLLLLARLDAAAAESAGSRPGPGVGAESDGGSPAASVIDPAPMDLRTLAADALVDVHSLDPERDVRLTGPDGGEPGQAPVLGDEARLRQVTVNLVGNAVIHTPAGTPLRIGVGTVGEEAIWEIEDAGPGLTPEESRRVFDRFYRVDPSRSRSAGAGAGLGLSIVQALVTAHGGHVTVRSAPGEGTTMRVALPRLADPG